MAVYIAGRNVGDCVDKFACELLSDAPAYVVDSSGHRLRVQHGFPEDKLSNCFLHWRRVFALVAFCVMIAWLVTDAGLPEAGALVPNYQDSYRIDAELPEDSPRSVNATTTICTCSYKNLNTYTPQAPLARIQQNIQVTCPDTLLRQCEGHGFNASKVLRNGTSQELALYSILAQVCMQMLDLEMQSPIASAELQMVPWNNARFNDATRRVKEISQWGQNAIKVLVLPPDKLANVAIDEGVLAVKFLETNILTNVRASLGMEIVNATFTTDIAGNRINLTCDGLPSNRNDMPLSLEEWCVRDDSLGTFVRCGDIDDAYQAYHRWCAPVVCHKISAKSPYQRTVESLSIIGGVYGIVTLCVFAIIWRCCICLEIARKKHWGYFKSTVTVALTYIRQYFGSAPIPKPAPIVTAPPLATTASAASTRNASVKSGRCGSNKDENVTAAPLLVSTASRSSRSTASSCNTAVSPRRCDSSRKDQDDAEGGCCTGDTAV